MRKPSSPDPSPTSRTARRSSTAQIAAKWLDDANNPALTPEQRAAGKKAYEETIITGSFPNKPDGTPIKYRSDRGEVARRCQQPGADPRTARRRQEGL